MRLDHLFLSFPAGKESDCRAFWTGVIGMEEVAKPENLKGEGGGWFRRGTAIVHIGPDPDFSITDRPHPAFAISGLDAMADTLLAAGHDVTWDDRIVGVRRFFTHDPVGNKLEFMEEQVAE